MPLNEWFDTEAIFHLVDGPGMIYLVLSLIVLLLAKLVKGLLTKYHLDKEITEHDNKAIALPFAGFLLGVTIILWSVLTSPSSTDNVWLDLASTAMWSAIGVALLLFSQVINDKVLLRQFNNDKELVQDKNVGTGAVIAGTYVGTAIMIRPAVGGPDAHTLGESLMMTLIYFIAGQLAFILFGLLYERVVGYKLHDEIEKDNCAAGVSFGLALTAISILLSEYLLHFPSLPGLAVWFVISAFFLVATRILIDWLILPGATVDQEIGRDRNWGVALIEGASMIGLSLIITGSFAS
jgi:uncharacterized membrane protein YjfL (UPF0719 family)